MKSKLFLAIYFILVFSLKSYVITADISPIVVKQCFFIHILVSFQISFSEIDLSWLEYSKEQTFLSKDSTYQVREMCSSNYISSFKVSCSKPLKILAFARTLPLPTQVGNDKRVFHIVEALQAMGHQVQLNVFVNSPAKATAYDLFLLKSINVTCDLAPIFLYPNPDERVR